MRHYVEEADAYLDLPDDITEQEMEQVINESFPRGAGQESLALPTGGRITGLGAPGKVVKPVPAWRQAGGAVANKLPAVGRAIGTAAGISSAIGSSGASAPLAIPVAGAAGQMTGEAGKSLLTKLLFPQAEQSFSTPQELGAAGVEGASGAMLDAMLMRGGAEIGKTRPFESVESTFDPKSTISARVRDKATKSLLNPSQADPAEAKRVVQNVGKEKIDIAGGQGPSQIATRMKAAGGRVEDLIGEASMPISKAEAMKPLMEVRAKFAESGDSPSYVKAIDDYIQGFNEMHPSELLKPESAQEIKKFIYQTTKGESWGQNTFNPTIEAKKAVSSGLRQGLEQSAGPQLKAANQEMGMLQEMRPYVQKATEKAGEAGFTQGVKNRAKQVVARGAEMVNKGQRNAETVAPNRSNIGSPYKTLEDMFGMSRQEYKVAPDANTETRPNRLLEGPGTSMGGKNSFSPVKVPSQQEAGLARPALPPGRQFGPQEYAPKKTYSPSAGKGTPQSVDAEKVREIMGRIGSGKGGTVTAEEKVLVRDALKKLNIEVESALEGKARPNVSGSPNDAMLNAGERAKYVGARNPTASQSPQDMLREAGISFDGITPASELSPRLRSRGDAIWFTDPQTGSTGVFFSNEMTPEAIQKHLISQRKGNW